MLTVILDTNVLLQSMISSPRSSSRRVLERLFLNEFTLVMSDDTFDEALDVVTLPRIREEHHVNDDDIIGLFEYLEAKAKFFVTEQTVSPTVTRDLTDTKFLELAEVSQAEFLVTNDNRHLLPLKRHGVTRIVSPGEFLRILDRE